MGELQRDNELEDWTHRKSGDDRIRHRLRALFMPTDGEEDVEALIVERGREIQERTDQLQATVADLERREEETGRLRSAVEEMLRNGSVELDERHADLNTLAVDLGAREDSVRALERDSAVRKQELGAVELRRAAVERRESDLDARAAALDEREQRLESEPSPEPASVAAAPPVLATAHVVFLPGDGYRLVDADGPPPSLGAKVMVDGQTYVVTRVGRSPIPGDPRAYVYVEAP